MKQRRVHIGLRTMKTAIAILAALIIVDYLGATGDKLIFAMLGAMSVVQPTYKASVEACLTQIIGVSMGALFSVLLTALPISSLTAIGIGVIGIITIYNMFHIKLSPSLPCFILVMICISENMRPIPYALGRIWDTAIGLGVGMLINMLIFPYDNSRQIRSTMESLDKDLIHFLEELFDGDDILPDPERMGEKVAAMEKQLDTFADQRFLLHFRRRKRELEQFRTCDRRAKDLVSQLEVLSQIGRPGRLSGENRRRLEACGAVIRDERPLDSVMELDVVTNYHVGKILTLRRELLEALGGR